MELGIRNKNISFNFSCLTVNRNVIFLPLTKNTSCNDLRCFPTKVSARHPTSRTTAKIHQQRPCKCSLDDAVVDQTREMLRLNFTVGMTTTTGVLLIQWDKVTVISHSRLTTPSFHSSIHAFFSFIHPRLPSILL